MHKDKEENGMLSHMHHHDSYRSRELGAFEHGLLDGDMFLQVNLFLHIKHLLFFYHLCETKRDIEV